MIYRIQEPPHDVVTIRRTDHCLIQRTRICEPHTGTTFDRYRVRPRNNDVIAVCGLATLAEAVAAAERIEEGWRA